MAGRILRLSFVIGNNPGRNPYVLPQLLLC